MKSMSKVGIGILVVLGLGGLAFLLAIPLVLPAEEPEDPWALAFGAGLLWVTALAFYLAVGRKPRPWLGVAIVSSVVAVLTVIAIVATGFTSIRGVFFVAAAALTVLSIHRSTSRSIDGGAG